jgi:hypothetical protein
MADEQSTPNDGTTEAPQEGTTERLFGSQPTAKSTPPAPEPQQVQPPAPPVEAPKKEEPKPIPAPVVPEYLDMQELGDRKVRVKVEGQEFELPLREVVKGYQTDQYLTRKGQRIAEEKQKMHQPPVPNVQYAPVQPAQADDPLAEVVRPYLVPLQQELAQTREALSSLSNIAAPLKYQQNLKTLDTRLKTQGFKDFNEYVPKIEAELSGMAEEDQRQYDSPQGFETLYLRLKMQERAAAPTNPDARLRPNVPGTRVESGSAPSNIDDSRQQDAQLFEQARKSGSVRDWAKVFEFRDKPPGS